MNGKYICGKTPIMNPCDNGHKDVVKLLLAKTFSYIFRTLLLLADVRCRLVKVQLKAEINQSLFILIFVLELNF